MIRIPISTGTIGPHSVNLGDVLFLREPPAGGMGLVAGSEDPNRTTKFVLTVSRDGPGFLLRDLSMVEPFAHLRLASANSLFLRVLGTPDSAPKTPADATGIIGIAGSGAYLFCSTLWEDSPIAAIGLSDWRAAQTTMQVFQVFSSVHAWCSSWQLVHVNQWGDETEVLGRGRNRPTCNRVRNG
jgi:hypothetical protein